ncbi:hypothetical protein MNV49_001429 [Pseudohyphozyma bogoriensis]|nr:hypothetical protein MNV49_001429 [Pseudohyphozyma bogoriensis]
MRIDVPDEAIAELRTLLKASRVAPLTYENSREDRKYGIAHKWILDAKEHWETSFDWKKHEAQLNQFPQFKVPITSDAGDVYDIHFTGLFSQNQKAIPLIFVHGWPGSFIEFIAILKLLSTRYTPATLPYHVVVPSLPGYGFSSPPPLDRDFKLEEVAKMKSRPVHLNFFNLPKPRHVGATPITDLEKVGRDRADEFHTTGQGYSTEHGTRPSTLGFVLHSSPLALLAWVGEKFLEWSDVDLSIDDILVDRYVTLSLRFEEPAPTLKQLYVEKPYGYSYFPYEITPIPKAWAEVAGNLVFWRTHTAGGHFAAMEVPEVLLQDVEEFVTQVW